MTFLLLVPVDKQQTFILHLLPSCWVSHNHTCWAVEMEEAGKLSPIDLGVNSWGMWVFFYIVLCSDNEQPCGIATYSLFTA